MYCCPQHNNNTFFVFRQPLVILGEPGSGKTTFLAKLVEEIPKWLDNEAPAVLRFIGTTSKSSTTKELVISVCQQIEKLVGHGLDPTGVRNSLICTMLYM